MCKRIDEIKPMDQGSSIRGFPVIDNVKRTIFITAKCFALYMEYKV